jgi:hypothetical protein
MLWNGNEYEKATVMRFPKQPSIVHVMTNQRKLKNVKYFKDVVNLTRYYAKLYIKMNLGFQCKISLQQEEAAFCQHAGIKL